MRVLAFSKRNLKEILRDPLSLMFCLAFPIFIFLLMELIVSNIGVSDMSVVPQFAIENLTPSITIFGFTFLSLFSGMLVSKDRESSFQARLNSSPMKSTDFIIGYTIPILLIALIQIAVTFSMGFIFGLGFSFRLLLVIVALIPIALLFIFLGLLIGSAFNEKAVGGVSSIIINVAIVLSGMFFPLDNMSGAVVVIAKIFPFKNSLDIATLIIKGNYSNLLIPFVIVFAYLIVVAVSSVLVFKKSMKK